MHDAMNRRHLTASRSTVLSILAHSGSLTSDGIIDAWIQRHPENARHRQRLPRMLSDILWRVMNLERVQREGDSYALTPAGLIMIEPNEPPPEQAAGAAQT